MTPDGDGPSFDATAFAAAIRAHKEFFASATGIDAQTVDLVRAGAMHAALTAYRATSWALADHSAPVEAAEKQARAIARAICVEYRLSPERYEASGGEHPIIHVIVKHVAPALAPQARQNDRIEELEGALATAMAALQQIDHQATEALSKLDHQEGRG